MRARRTYCPAAKWLTRSECVAANVRRRRRRPLFLFFVLFHATQEPLPRGTICWLGQRWHEEKFVCTVAPACIQQLVFQRTGIKYTGEDCEKMMVNKDFHLEVYLHLECDDWGGDMMEPDKKGRRRSGSGSGSDGDGDGDGDGTTSGNNAATGSLKYKLWRMVPPSVQHFYFSLHFVENPFSSMKVSAELPQLNSLQRHSTSPTAKFVLANLGANGKIVDARAAAAAAFKKAGGAAGGGGGGKAPIARRASRIGLPARSGKPILPRRRSSMNSLKRQLTNMHVAAALETHLHRSMLTFTTAEYQTETWEQVLLRVHSFLPSFLPSVVQCPHSCLAGVRVRVGVGILRVCVCLWVWVGVFVCASTG